MDVSRLDAISDFHAHTLASYDSLVTCIIDGLIPINQIPASLAGATPTELNTIMKGWHQELNRAVVLTTVAITENEIRMHYESVGKKQIPELKAIYRDHKTRAHFEEILDAWRIYLDPPRVVSLFKQVLTYRHWLAHGRPHTKRPSEFTPQEASTRARTLLTAIESYP